MTKMSELIPTTETQKALDDSETREEIFRRWRKDPVAFVKEVYGLDLSPMQEEIVAEWGVTESLLAVVNLKNKHADTWRNRPETYWFQCLMDEVEELADALIGIHEHPPETELMQIASICLNWLEMREEKRCGK